ncbi:type VI secretion system protein [Robbsia sp. KACC 23696]|uniref:type VI secretion system protein n=1 Tax=Robbsia sp. KACC 23696 TaxID=3149231 RepID=UPI00325AF42F
MNNVSVMSLLSSLPTTALTMAIAAALGSVALIATMVVLIRRRWIGLHESRAMLAAGMKGNRAAPRRGGGAPAAGNVAATAAVDAEASGVADRTRSTDSARDPDAANVTNATSLTNAATLASVLRALREGFRACADRVDARIGARRMHYGAPCVLVLNASRDARPLPLSNLDVTPWSPISASHVGHAADGPWPSRLVAIMRRRLAARRVAVDDDEPAAMPAMPGMTWRCADRGVVIELRHPLIDHASSSGVPGQPQPVWDAFLRCCRRYRPGRPLDAVVLVVPARLLRDDSVQGQVALKEAAQLAHQRLWHLQRLFAMRVTVYVVIGECEAIPGFRAFAQGFSVPARDSMVGWSSPYSPDRRWEPDWVDEAMTRVLENVADATMQQFADPRRDDRERDRASGIDGTAAEWIALSGEWAAMRQPLHRYIEALMRPNAYHDPFLLRGIYWGGDAADCPPSAPLVASGSEPAFYRDLLLCKVFAEVGLTRASSTQFLRARSGRRIALWGAAACFATWTAGIGLASWQTATRAKVVAATLRDVLLDESAMSAAAQHQEAMPADWYRNKTIALLAVDTTLAGPLARIAMPGMWLPFDRLEARASARFQQVFGDVAVVALDQAFRRKMQRLTRDAIDRSEAADAGWRDADARGGLPEDAIDNTTPTPRDMPAMRDVQTYLDDVDALAQALLAWERLHAARNADARGAADADDFRTVFRDVMAHDVRGDVAHRLRTFYRYVNDASRPPSVVDPDVLRAVQRAWQLRAARARHDVLSASPLLSADRRVDALVRALGQGDGQDGASADWPARYTEIVAALDDEAAMVEGGAWRWVLSEAEGPPRQPMRDADARADAQDAGDAGASASRAVVGPTPPSRPVVWPVSRDVDRIAGRIARNALLGPVHATDWREGWARGRRGLQSDMAQWLSDPGSGLVWRRVDATWHVKPERTALRSAFTALLAQPYMAPTRAQVIPAPADQQVLRWRLEGLTAAAMQDDARQQFIGKTVLPLTPDVAQAITRGVEAQRAVMLLHRLGESAQRVPISAMDGPVNAAAASSAPAVRVALARIADALTALGAQPAALQLQMRVSADAMSWLAALDRALTLADPYAIDRAMTRADACGRPRAGAGDRAVSGDAVAWPIACAFGVHTQQGLTSFVGAQSANVVASAEQAKAQLPLLAAADAQSELARKWRAIVLDLARHAVRSPTSSLLQLEQFILAVGRPENGSAPAADACTRIAAAPPESLPQDYFGETQWQLYRWLSAQCRAANVLQRRTAWQAFQNVFNAELAGRAPFAMPSWRHDAGPMAAADPRQIARALALFGHFVAQPGPVDAESRAFGLASTPASVTTFARQFAAMAPVLASMTPAPSLASTQTTPATLATVGLQKGLRIRVAFRVNQAAESYGNQIIDWTFQSGVQRVSKPRDALTAQGPAALAWQPGDPIVLTLRLADEAQIRIRTDPHQPALATDGKTVTFRFDDLWALLTMIDRQRLAKGGATETLAFSFPVVPCIPGATQTCDLPIAAATLAQVDALDAHPRSGTEETLNARVFIGVSLQSDERSTIDAASDAVQQPGAVTAVRPIDWPARRPQGAPAW